MGKIFTTIATLFIVGSIYVPRVSHAYAQEYLGGSSAALHRPTISTSSDSRAIILREYLKQYDSPLTDKAEVFVKTADKYDLDWKFVAAICGLESTFGRHIPYNSYNGWGWGIFGDNMVRFSSWEEGIETVSRDLRVRFINKWGAKDIYAIGKLYASSPTWAQRVESIMNSIEKFKDDKLATNLSISL